MIDIITLSLSVGVWICSPTLDRKKEILLHFWSAVMHPISDFHRGVFRVQIDFQRFIFDRNVGVPVIFRGSGVTRCRNSGLPGPAVAKKS